MNDVLGQHQQKELVRFLTCGSVDDGKSTLIGRLLHDSSMVYEDQLAAVQRASKGEEADLSLLVDGLKAEREQGITIDVAYRYFSTPKRKFIIADCPGHEQYTRNMATGASNCDLAIILIDARKGILAQTKRHSFIVSLLGIKHVIVAVNKMDLVGYDAQVFDRIVADYRDLAARLAVDDIRFIPLSALKGDNVVESSAAMPWYGGGTLMYHLENVHTASDRNLIDLRFPVQWVVRTGDFRGVAGTLASGVLRAGDTVKILPRGQEARVRDIVSFAGNLTEAFAPQSVCVTFTEEVDVSRGDMLVHVNNQPTVTHTFDAMVVWMSEAPLVLGQEVLCKHTTKLVRGRVTEVVYGIDVNTVHRVDQETLALNHIGRCRLETFAPLCVESYERNRTTGAFILIDPLSNGTVAAGMVLARGAQARDLWQGEGDRVVGLVSHEERAARYGQRPATVLLTGLTASGKTSVARALERRLFDAGHPVVVLDGQSLRHGISRDLDFSEDGRSENLRRFAEVSAVLNDAGLIVIGAFVAPAEAVRHKVAERIGPARCLVVHLACGAAICASRDDTGLYARAAAGEVSDFPGVTAPYEPPSNPACVLDTAQLSVDACAERLVELLKTRGLVD